MSAILAEALRRKFAEGAEDDKPSLPLPEAQVATLREIFARYTAPCPFKPGDLVTPRDGYSSRGAGIPHVVLEIGAPPGEPSWPTDPSDTSSSVFGRRMDMRVVAHAERGWISAWWVESWTFEAWEERTSEPEPIDLRAGAWHGNGAVF